MRNFIVIFVMMMGALTMKAQTTTVVDTAVCDGTTFELYDHTGTTLLMTLNAPLDSVFLYGTAPEDTIYLHLAFYPTYSHTDTMSILGSDLPYAYGSHTFPVGTVTGDYPIMFKTVNGCDSLITLSLTIHEGRAVSWLKSENRVSAYGNSNAAHTLAGFMEFYKEDLINFNSTNKSIVGIKKIQFFMDTAAFPVITACKVIIMQGNDITTATVKHTQEVIGLVKNWNTIDLSSDYTVDLNQKLYIGYEVTTSKGAYSLALGSGTEPKQAWARGNDGFSNLITDRGYSYVFLIKAMAIVADPPENKMAFSSFILGKYMTKGDVVTIRGTVKNLGKNSLTSFKVKYTVDGTTSTTETFNVNVAPGATYEFIHSETYTLNQAKAHNFAVTVSDVNNTVDGVIGDATRNATIMVYLSRVYRTVLHEVFTGSTCIYCKKGNEDLKQVLDSKNPNNWACVKYQYNFPSPGDPYYTSECNTRATFYGGISGVPHLICDGGELFDDHPGYYTSNYFNQLANVPAAATMSGTSTITDKTVNVKITINPVTDMNNSNIRLFAAIVEKETFQNVKTNGETIFYFVMKKFMSNVNGDAISPLVAGTPVSRDLSYTFNGNYRLPANASSPINHSSEHSVENFANLMVVYWIQDVVTKEVFQAGYPGSVPVTVTDFTSNSPLKVVIYPNPTKDNLHIDMDGDISKIEIFNIHGQCLKAEITKDKTISTSNLASGMYMLRITSEKGVSVHKFVKE